MTGIEMQWRAFFLLAVAVAVAAAAAAAAAAARDAPSRKAAPTQAVTDLSYDKIFNGGESVTITRRL